jgi:hypothetical protein
MQLTPDQLNNLINALEAFTEAGNNLNRAVTSLLQPQEPLLNEEPHLTRDEWIAQMREELSPPAEPQEAPPHKLTYIRRATLGADGFSGLLYLHTWATGSQELVFDSTFAAEAFENGLNYRDKR